MGYFPLLSPADIVEGAVIQLVLDTPPSEGGHLATHR